MIEVGFTDPGIPPSSPTGFDDLIASTMRPQGGGFAFRRASIPSATLYGFVAQHLCQPLRSLFRAT
jgi:hypothetical protein